VADSVAAVTLAVAVGLVAAVTSAVVVSTAAAASKQVGSMVADWSQAELARAAVA
jgi:hypothetical protein